MRRARIVTRAGLRPESHRGRIRYYSNERSPSTGKRIRRIWGYDADEADKAYLAAIRPQLQPLPYDEQDRKDVMAQTMRALHIDGSVDDFITEHGEYRDDAIDVAEAKLNRMYLDRLDRISEEKRKDEEIYALRKTLRQLTPANAPTTDIKTVTDMGKVFLADKQGEINETSYKNYDAQWEQFCKITRNIRVAEISKDTIRKYRERIKGLAPSDHYTAQRFTSIKAVFNHVFTEHDVDGVSDDRAAVILAYLKLLKGNYAYEPDPRPIAPGEFKALLAVVDSLATDADLKAAQTAIKSAKHGSPEYQSLTAKINKARQRISLAIQFRAMYLTALNLAFYPIDCARFTRESINWDTGALFFRREKKNTPRIGVLWQPTRDALKKWYEVCEYQTDLVFVNSYGNPWTTNVLGHRIKDHIKLSKGAIPKDVTFASFRDGAQQAAQEKFFDEASIDKDERLIKLLSGHKTDISDKYVKRMPVMVANVCRAIADYYGLE